MPIYAHFLIITNKVGQTDLIFG